MHVPRERRDVAYNLASPDWCYVLTLVHAFQLRLTLARLTTLDAANQGVGNGHRL